MKLYANYFGPFENFATIGQVAYKLKLPESVCVHLVFHVSQLKKYVGPTTTQTELPLLNED